MGYCGIPADTEARVGVGRRFLGMGFGRGPRRGLGARWGRGPGMGRGLGAGSGRGFGMGCGLGFGYDPFGYGHQWRRCVAGYFPTYGAADEETALQEESDYLKAHAALIQERLGLLSKALEKAQDAKKRTGDDQAK